MANYNADLQTVKDFSNKSSDSARSLGLGLNQDAHQSIMKEVEREQAISTLSKPGANTQDKLAAAELLYKQGFKELEIHDNNGPRHVRLELEKTSQGKEMVHVFANDAHGKERIVLRGIDQGNGSFAHETKQNGEEVSFNGKSWKEEFSNLSGNDDAERQRAAAVLGDLVDLRTGTHNKAAAEAPAKTTPEGKTEPERKVETESKSKQESPFADRVKLGKAEGPKQLPESISIEGSPSVHFKHVEIAGHDDYIDSASGRYYRIQLDAKNGSVKAIEISDPAAVNGGTMLNTRSWLKGGNEVKVIGNDKAQTVEIRTASGALQSNAEFGSSAADMPFANLPSIDGSTLKFERGNALTFSGNITDLGKTTYDDHYYANNKPYHVFVNQNTGAASYTRLDENDCPKEKTTIYPNGNMVVTSTDTEGRDLQANKIKVNGHIYTHGIDGAWRDKSTNKKVSVSIEDSGEIVVTPN